jgi:hypothetical protein
MSDKIDQLKQLPSKFDATRRKIPGMSSVGTLVGEVESVNPLSEKAKSTIIKSTQSAITEIHKSSAEYTAGMSVKNSEAIASIGIAHESKASEAIQAIERMNESGLKSISQESKNTKKGVFMSALLAFGAVGGALTVIQKLRK